MPLVYPRSITGSSLGITGRDSFESAFVDYLQIKIYSSERGNPYSYIGQGSGTNTNYGEGKVIGGGGEAEGSINETIYLYLPPQLKESYSTQYQKTTVGAAGMAALDAFANAAAGNEQDLIGKIQDTAKGVTPQFVMDKIASAVGTVNSAVMGAGNAGNLDANSIGALTKRKIFNPYQETTFRGTNYRSHTFTFQCQARNPKEAQELFNIIAALRKAMLPGLQDSTDEDPSAGGGVSEDVEGETNQNIVNAAFRGGASGSGRWLTIPDYFRLDIIRVEGRANADGEVEMTGSSPMGLKRIMQFPTKLVLKDLNLNLSPNGPYNSLKDALDTGVDYGPANFQMTLTFDETAFLTKASIADI